MRRPRNAFQYLARHAWHFADIRRDKERRA
jgi:hypothetical protein